MSWDRVFLTPAGGALAAAVVWAVDSPRHACLRGLLWARTARRRAREEGGDVAGWTAVVELLSRMLVTVAQWEREPLSRTATVGRPSGSDVSGQPPASVDATGATEATCEAIGGADGRCAEPSERLGGGE